MTTHLEVLVEEQSAERALSILFLPQLRGYASWIGAAGVRVVVLVDEDRQDCLELKARLEDAARSAGLPTRATAVTGQPVLVVNRIAIEELERSA